MLPLVGCLPIWLVLTISMFVVGQLVQNKCQMRNIKNTAGKSASAKMGTDLLYPLKTRLQGEKGKKKQRVGHTWLVLWKMTIKRWSLSQLQSAKSDLFYTPCLKCLAHLVMLRFWWFQTSRAEKDFSIFQIKTWVICDTGQFDDGSL